MRSNIGSCSRRHSTFRSTIYRRYSGRDICRGAGCRRGRITTVGIGRNKRSFSRLEMFLHFLPFSPPPPLPLRSDGFRRSWKSSATSREISRMLKAPRIKVERVSTQCSRTMTMTNRRVGQVLPLLTIRTTIAACPIRA